MGKEQQIQNTILEFLQWNKYYCKRINSGMIKIEKRCIKMAPPGNSDIQGNTPDGRAFYVEVKAGKNTATKLQQDFIDARLKEKCIAFVAWNVEDVIEGFKKVGYIL